MHIHTQILTRARTNEKNRMSNQTVEQPAADQPVHWIVWAHGCTPTYSQAKKHPRTHVIRISNRPSRLVTGTTPDGVTATKFECARARKVTWWANNLCIDCPETICHTRLCFEEECCQDEFERFCFRWVTRSTLRLSFLHAPMWLLKLTQLQVYFLLVNLKNYRFIDLWNCISQVRGTTITHLDHRHLFCK